MGDQSLCGETKARGRLSLSSVFGELQEVL